MENKNKWILQVRKSNIFFGFSGEKDFVKKSVNFCYNYGIADPNKDQIKSINDENYKYIKTKIKKLVKALHLEGRVLKIRSLVKVDENIDLTKFQKEIKLAGKKHCRKQFEKIEKGLIISNSFGKNLLEEFSIKK